MDLRSAVQQTKNDTEKIKGQIQSILTALIKNSNIVEVDLTPINAKGRKNGKEKRLADCDKNWLINTHFDILDSETFLLPYIDKWIWGTTVLNINEKSAGLPELHLVASKEECTSDIGNRKNDPLCYSYSASLVEVTLNDLRNEQQLNYHTSIPFQETFLTKEDDTGKGVQIRPGCKAWITGIFSDPLGTSSKVSITASIFCDKIYQWSSSFEINNLHGLTLYNENTFKKHRSQILSALTAQNRTCFTIERRFSQVSKSPSKVFQKFLAQLGFNPISTVQTGADSWIDTLTSEKPTLFQGILVKVERKSSEIDSSQCSVATKSGEQMQLFGKLFSTWVTEESDEDRRRGLKGLIISNSADPESGTSQPHNGLKSKLSLEITLLQHLINLTDKQWLNSSKFTNEWLAYYSATAAESDLHFMTR